MVLKKLLKKKVYVGDVISATDFKYGKDIGISLNDTKSISVGFISENENITELPERSKKLYLVIEAKEENGWHVFAKEIDSKTFKEKKNGELIDFFQSGKAINIICPVIKIAKVNTKS